VPWHTIAISQVFRELACKPVGLTEAEAQQRLERFGPSRLPQERGPGPLRRLLAQFDNVLIYVLLAAAAVTMALGHWVDTSVILGVVVINAVLGAVQEGKAERALDAIRNMLSLHAMAVRDGQRRAVPAERLVPGDLVFLQSGDRVPADLRLVRNKGLQTQEGALTGESLPVEKRVDPVAADALLGDRTSMAYSGTLITYGQGTGVVVATGTATEIGRISGLLAQVEPLTTPLLRQMARFARWLTGAILALAALTLVFGVLIRDYGLGEMFLAAVGLAVAAVPECLPAVLTITLAIGVERMAQRHAIIRHLPAVETLGSITVICSDKTGTLTKNEMTVRSIACGDDVFKIGGWATTPTAHSAWATARCSRGTGACSRRSSGQACSVTRRPFGKSRSRAAAGSWTATRPKARC
jgi:magnesium-transporting ATPase (P-type)